MIPTPEQLAAEIQSDPVGMGYAGKTIPEQHTLLHALSRTKRQPFVPMDEVRNFHVTTGVLLKLQAAETNTAIDDALDPMTFVGAGKRLRDKIHLFIFTLSSSNFPLNFDNSDVVSYLPLFVQLGIVTGFEAQAFNDLANVPCSRADELWGQSVGLGYLCRAMWPEEFALVESQLEAAQMNVSVLEQRLQELQSGISEVEN